MASSKKKSTLKPLTKKDSVSAIEGKSSAQKRKGTAKKINLIVTEKNRPKKSANKTGIVKYPENESKPALPSVSPPKKGALKTVAHKSDTGGGIQLTCVETKKKSAADVLKRSPVMEHSKKSAVKTIPKKKVSPVTEAKTRSKTAMPKKKTPEILEFPKTRWGNDSIVSFEATEQMPPHEMTSIAGGFVFHQDKLVVVNVPGRGWEIIGGRIDVGETPEETFCREAMNQIGVTLSHVKMVGVVRIEHTGPEPPNCPYPYPVGYGIQYIGIVSEYMPFSGGPDSLGRSLIPPEGFKEHYFEWNEYFDAVFKYAHSVYIKWRKKLKL